MFVRQSAFKPTRVKRTHRTSRRVQLLGQEGINMTGGRSSVSGIVTTIFGATGFIGKGVAQYFGDIGSQIVVPYRYGKSNEKCYRHLRVVGDPGQVIPTEWDINNRDSTRYCVRHSNVVINLVGQRDDTSNYDMEEVHVKRAVDMALAAKEVGATFIHVSGLGVSEDSNSKWSRTKALGEKAVREAYPEAIIMRPGPIYGPLDNYISHLGSMWRYWPAYLCINPSQRVQPIHTTHVGEAILMSVANKENLGKTFELGGDEVFTNRSLAETLRGYLHYDNKQIVELEHDEEELVGKLLGMTRVPRVTLSEVQFTEDRVVSPNAYGLKHLGVKALPFEYSCYTSILHYRKALRADAMLAEDKNHDINSIFQHVERAEEIF